MPQKSGFFDSTADDPREYPAREFAEYFSRFVGNGVFLGGTKLKATASGQDANVKVEIGYGWINGYMYAVYDESLTLPIQPATTQDRIDRIILRLDTSTPVRAVRALVVQGIPTASPTAPALVRSGNIYDLSLAQIRVVANTTVVKPENITDERLNNQVCGIVTALIDQADTTSIFNQFQAWLNTKTAQYQQQWTDFMQSIQDQGFATTQYVDQKIAAIPLPPNASTTVKGIAQLSSAVNSTSELLAATPKAVKEAYDRAEQAFQSANDGKNIIASAVSGKGVPSTGSDTFAVLAAKIGQINTGKRWATGIAARGAVNITGLQFQPRLIAVALDSGGGTDFSSFGGLFIDGATYGNTLAMNLAFYRGGSSFQVTPFTVSASGFVFNWTLTGGSLSFRWVAFE